MTRMNLDQLANVRERVLFCAVYVVLFVLFIRIVFLPQSAAISQIQSRLEALNTEKKVLVNFQLSTPNVTPVSLPLHKRGIKMKILAGDVRDDFDDLMTMLAQFTNRDFLGELKIVNLAYVPPAADKGFSRTSFTLNIQGSFTNVMRYVERLEEFPALVSVDQISLKLAEGQSQDVESEIRGSFYQIGGDLGLTTAQQGPQVAAPQGKGGN